MATVQLRRFVKDNCPKPILNPLLVVWGHLRARLGYQRFVTHRPTGVEYSSHGDAAPELIPYFDLLSRFDDKNPVAIDLAHNFFIIGSVLAKKPQNVLELGMGSGYLTSSLIHALQYNKAGKLTTVDSWYDSNGREPPVVKDFRKSGVNIVCQAEEQFVKQASTDEYDFLISDADHMRSHEWLDQHVRIVKPDGIMFFHDTNNPEIFPGLATLEGQIIERRLPYIHFKQDSRPGERCSRGLLFVINRKEIAMR
jgi:ubiquinone/menaquinone biosynthesis C-methylase UbiE